MLGACIVRLGIFGRATSVAAMLELYDVGYSVCSSPCMLLFRVLAAQALHETL